MEMVWDWKSITSLLATLVFIRTAFNDFLPPELRHFVTSLLTRLYTSRRPSSSLIIEEFDISTGNTSTNEIFDAVQSYLSSRCLAAAPVLRLSKTKNSKSMISSLPSSHSTTDEFEGVKMNWVYRSTVDRGGGGSSGIYLNPFGRGKGSGAENRYFEVTFHRRYKEMAQTRYVGHILEEARKMRLKERERRLYTNRPFGNGMGDDHHSYHWSSVSFHHPSTFDTLAIDPGLRESIRSDLLRFSSHRDFYSRVGRAWKRGYLLHGPPGTGKTSLIAAIANFLEFDIYDLELTAVHSNTQLRKLLFSTTPRSVIVVEDVDCSLDLSDRNKNKTISDASTSDNLHDEFGINNNNNNNNNTLQPASVNLSGVLNFVDGLWSSCVGERLMIFTTNHPEKLDPALLRPGRMDRKIHLSYCEPAAFKVLARNYMEVEEQHAMMEEVETLLREVKVTPAEIAELFMECDGHGADVGMKKVVEELKRRRAELKS